MSRVIRRRRERKQQEREANFRENEARRLQGGVRPALQGDKRVGRGGKKKKGAPEGCFLRPPPPPLPTRRPPRLGVAIYAAPFTVVKLCTPLDCRIRATYNRRQDVLSHKCDDSNGKRNRGHGNMGQWQIRVKGKQREPVNLELVVQAVIA